MMEWNTRLPSVSYSHTHRPGEAHWGKPCSAMEQDVLLCAIIAWELSSIGSGIS